MKNIVNIIIICLIATMSAGAQRISGRSAYNAADENMLVDKQQVVTPRYSSPIYEPFSNTVPSDQSEVGAGQSSGGHKGAIRRGFDTPGEENQSPEYPIGDAVLPLMLVLTAYCTARVYRRRRRA